MNSFPKVLLIVLGLALAACTVAPDKRVLQYLNTDGFGKRYTGNSEEENYVTIGDSIRYTDTLNVELTDVVQVDIDGTVILPEVGAVHVAGLTRTELEALLTQKFAPYFQRNDVKVEIQTGSRVYYVLGEVGTPGQKPFTGDVTLFDAVLTSNPERFTANLGRVRLIRADPRDPLVIRANIAEMMRGGDSTFNVLVRENDIIVVPPTFLAQVGNFISALITPVTTVLGQVSRAIAPVLGFGNRFRRNGVGNQGVFGGVF